MGIGPLVCINNLLITPVGNVDEILAIKVKELRILVGSDFFIKSGNYHHEIIHILIN